MNLAKESPGKDRPDDLENFESDTQRIIHRHLENKDDIITDEDIRNVRVGVAPAIPDDVTLQRFEEDQNEGGTEENTQTTWNVIDGE